MSDEIVEDTLELRAWAVFERALDDAIASDRGDVAALELGVRVAEMLVNNRIVAPPQSGRSRDGSSSHGTPRLAAPAPLELHVHASDTDVPAIAARVAETVASIEAEYGCPMPSVPVRNSSALDAGGYELRSLGDVLVAGMLDGPDRVPAELVDALLRAMPDLLDREVAAELLNDARRQSPMVVQELVPNMLALGQLRQVLQILLRERVPIRNLSNILNALADVSVYTKDPNALAERTRSSLARTISERHASDNVISALELSPDTARMIEGGVQLNETGQVLVLDPADKNALLGQINDAIQRHGMPRPLLIVAPKIRRHIHALLVRTHPNAVVMTDAEVAPDFQVRVLDVIDVPPTDQSDQPKSKAPGASGGSWLGA
ncbi:MAG: flagellar biosynthesis protein FlhA [Thermoleophilia bacterium]|nr:flagellar biosynthesis protein FlhA [Thermoleophilia bacterium]